MLFESPLLSKASGSLAGNTFSHNKGGMYIRSRAMPTNPGTENQSAVRDSVRILMDNWSNVLTQAQRDAWDLYAFNTPVVNKLGQTVKRTGQNMYVRANTARMQAEFPAVNDAPVTFDLGSFTPVEITADASADTLSIAVAAADPWATEDQGFMFVYQSRPQNAARRYFKGPYQLATVIEGESPGPITSPKVVSSLFPLTTGQRVFFRVTVGRADGRYTDAQYLDSIVVA